MPKTFDHLKCNHIRIKNFKLIFKKFLRSNTGMKEAVPHSIPSGQIRKHIIHHQTSNLSAVLGFTTVYIIEKIPKKKFFLNGSIAHN